MSDEKRHEKLLLALYKAISDQIIHWDAFFWSKSQFFLAVQSGALFAVTTWLVKLPPTIPIEGWISELLALLVGLNLFLCVAWLRTGRNNREFLNIRFQVAKVMEQEMKIPLFALYTYQNWLRGDTDSADVTPTKKRRSLPSHHLEISIPTALMVVWMFLLLRTLVISPLLPFLAQYGYWAVPFIMIPFSVLVIYLEWEASMAVRSLPETGDESDDETDQLQAQTSCKQFFEKRKKELIAAPKLIIFP